MDAVYNYLNFTVCRALFVCSRLVPYKQFIVIIIIQSYLEVESESDSLYFLQ